MKSSIWDTSLVCLLCFVDFIKLASSTKLTKPMDIIDNYIRLAEKRDSIVDGGVFVPYKSTTIVYKSRLVPVTYGFVIKKETLKDNPALYKLGVKLLDDKVEPTPTKQVLDDKKVEEAPEQLLDPKSNCVKGSRVLSLLAKLNKDIQKIEKAILAQNLSNQPVQKELTSKSLKKIKETQKPQPQHEMHVSGHKGLFEKKLNKKNSSKQHTSKNLSRYWQCRRSHSSEKCAVLLLMKHAHSRVHQRVRQGEDDDGQYIKHQEKHRARDDEHYDKHQKKNRAGNDDHDDKHQKKHRARDDDHYDKHQKKHPEIDVGKHRGRNEDKKAKHPARHKKQHRVRNKTHVNKHNISKHSFDNHKRKHRISYKHLVTHSISEKHHLDKHNMKYPVKLSKREKIFRKKTQLCKNCKIKHKHKILKHRSLSQNHSR